ncbi:3-hydroxybutyryl-CoA dehydrogenase [Moorella sp. ACPs]|uniref:3-hydroxybutyryl-CoA dehydrogenase n=1 Tax=Neomoorella carbonis TaxID=3062783 RepID=UPI0038734B10
MNKVMVLGAGTMGAGIVQVMAQAGLSVVMCDVDEQFLQRGMATIEKNLERMVAKNKLTEDEKQAVLGRILPSLDKGDGADAELVVEAIIENLEAKIAVFQELDNTVNKNAIFASNTSALSISALASATSRPEKVIGMHFFNPVQVMQLVEVIKGAATAEETVSSITSLVKQLGKTPVTLNEAPGFIVNRMLVPMINEAAYILMEGVASVEDIDTAMKLGANHPIGPLALADMIGIDICLAVMETLYREFGDSKYRPCPLLRKLVRAGYLGRKTGRGFYNYLESK